MYAVYVLMSEKDGKFYVGYTKDLHRRLSEHERGIVDSTRPRRALHLVFYEAFVSEQDARRREAYFKTTHGRRTLRLMLRRTLDMRPASNVGE